MKDVISVDTIAELFWDGYEHQECDDSCPVAGKYNQAVKDLHSLLISKLPEKKELESYESPWGKTISDEDRDSKEGYNSAIDDMHRVIDEMVNVKEKIQ